MPHREMHHGGLHPIKLDLSHAQVLKARAGHQIQVAHHQIGHGHTFHLHPETHKKLHTAHRARKGARIHITHHELAGSGFLDILKKVASPVLSGLAGVAGELFPSHKDTINKVREGVRTATGYGLRPRKQMHHGHAMHSEHHGFMHGDALHHRPGHFPGQKTDHYGFGLKHKTHKKSGGPARALRSSQPAKRGKGITSGYGTGILPSGYGY